MVYDLADVKGWSDEDSFLFFLTSDKRYTASIKDKAFLLCVNGYKPLASVWAEQ